MMDNVGWAGIWILARLEGTVLKRLIYKYTTLTIPI